MEVTYVQNVSNQVGRMKVHICPMNFCQAQPQVNFHFISGSQIIDIFDQIANEKHCREELFGEIQKRYDEMERKEVQALIRKQCDQSEKVLEKKICEEIENRNTNNIAIVNEYMK